jgi:hypothetical protein
MHLVIATRENPRLPFGLLVFKSGFFPGILGVLLIIACFGYLVEAWS